MLKKILFFFLFFFFLFTNQTFAAQVACKPDEYLHPELGCQPKVTNTGGGDLPFVSSILSQNPLKNPQTGVLKYRTLGDIISAALNLIFVIAGTIMLVMLIYGAVQVLLSAGDKEKVGKARARIIWSIVGFVVIMLSFLLSQYVQELFNTNTPRITPITRPDDVSKYLK